MKQIDFPGGFSDVTSHEGFIYVVTMGGAQVTVKRLEADGSLHPVVAFPCEGNGFPRLRSVSSGLLLAYRPQSGQEVVIYNVTTGESRVITGGSFYNWPVVIGQNGYAINFNGTDGNVVVYGLDGQVVNTFTGIGRGTGLARLEDDNQRVVTNDDNYASQLQAWGLYNPEYAGEVFCGNGNEGGVGCVYQHRDKSVLMPPVEAQLPKIAQHGNTWAIISNDFATGLATLRHDITVADLTGQPEPPIPPDPPTPPSNTIYKFTVPSLKAGDQIVITAT